ncbi:MAG: hypothetical protein RLZZ337_636, partial [Bacteroidota bacterium]
VNHISKNFGKNQIFSNVHRQITRGDKIALIGANGTGKSTFLRIIANEEQFEGKRTEGHNVVTSFYAQHQLESLKLENEILEELKYDAPHKLETELRSMLGCFLFSGDDVFKPIKVLSGGEKARVSLAKTLVSEANFLLLDEPTNHLDIDSIEIIIEALKRYEGTLIFVSHNRYFIEKLANKIWWIEDEDVKEYPGTYKEYLYKLEKDKAAGITPSTNPGNKQKEEAKEDTSKNTWKQRDENEVQLKKLQKELEQKEAALEKLVETCTALEKKLADASSLSASEIEKLGKEHGQLKTAIEEATEVCELLIEEIILLEE